MFPSSGNWDSLCRNSIKIGCTRAAADSRLVITHTPDDSMHFFLLPLGLPGSFDVAFASAGCSRRSFSARGGFFGRSP